jgi:hypothetical protein
LKEIRKKILELDNSLKSIVSKENISYCVQKKILENPETNIDIVPDFIEKIAYVEGINIILKMLSKASNTTYVELMGHRIRFIIEPMLDISETLDVNVSSFANKETHNTNKETHNTNKETHNTNKETHNTNKETHNINKENKESHDNKETHNTNKENKESHDNKESHSKKHHSKFKEKLFSLFD